MPWRQRTASRARRRVVPSPEAVVLTAVLMVTALLAACGGGSATQAGTPETNEAPVIGGSAPATAVEGQAYLFTPTASDPDGDTLRFSAEGLPAWATLDAASGVIGGTPPAGSAGETHRVTLFVSDGSVTTPLPAFMISVVAGLPSSARPFGIYAIDTLVDRPFVDGVLVRARWSEMEPEEGRYDFSKIDLAIRSAVAAGKSVTLASLVNFAPDWLRTKSAQFQHRDESLIVPWDPTMLEALARLAEAQAAHRVDGIALRDHPALLQVNATIGGITSIRLVDLPPQFDAERFALAVERSIGIWASAYPTGKHLYVGLFAVNDGQRNPSTAERIRDRLLDRYDGHTAPRLHFYQELLTGLAPQLRSDLAQVLLGAAGRSAIMFQACGPWTEQGNPTWPCNWATPSDSPAQGLAHGIDNFGSLYFEIYNKDLLEESYQAQFDNSRRRIDTLR